MVPYTKIPRILKLNVTNIASWEGLVRSLSVFPNIPTLIAPHFYFHVPLRQKEIQDVIFWTYFNEYVFFPYFTK